jgi:23S rRNA (uracil1939-C5)-methyltransferase
MNFPVKRKQELQIIIEKLAFGGKGIARLNDYVIFIKDTIPGDEVIARIVRRKAAYAEAKVLQIVRPSQLRIEPPCPYFAWCGGCTWQNISYEEQLQFKHKQVVESLMHLANLESVVVRDALAAETIWGYRNKMEFSFSDRRWLLPSELGNIEIDRSYALGLHISGTFDKILDIDNCLLQSDVANKVLKLTDEYCIDQKLEPYGIKTHQGYLRFLVIRESKYNNDIMVNIVTAQKKPELLISLANMLIDKIPQVCSVINNINSKKAQIAFGEEEIVLAGKDHIEEKIGAFGFKISANSFFQTNTSQTSRLYRLVMEFAELKSEDIVWDLYAGTGTISLFLARHAKFIYGFELAESAVQDAMYNAHHNNQENIKFISGDLLDNLSHFSPKPDVIVVDPPRSGMHPKVCEFISTSEARCLVYVSCNPTTMARDIKLIENSYQLKKVQPVDMFPHTYHIETVSQLGKK